MFLQWLCKSWLPPTIYSGCLQDILSTTSLLSFYNRHSITIGNTSLWSWLHILNNLWFWKYLHILIRISTPGVTNVHTDTLPNFKGIYSSLLFIWIIYKFDIIIPYHMCKLLFSAFSWIYSFCWLFPLFLSLTIDAIIFPYSFLPREVCWKCYCVFSSSSLVICLTLKSLFWFASISIWWRLLASFSYRYLVFIDFWWSLYLILNGSFVPFHNFWI